MKLPCFNWLSTYVWRDSGTSQSFTEQFVLERCFQHSSTSWTGHTPLFYLCCWRLGIPDQKQSLSFSLAPLRMHVVSHAPRPAREEKIFGWREWCQAPHLYFQPNERLRPGNVMEMGLSWLHSCHPFAGNDRPGQSFTCPESKQAIIQQRYCPENLALHMQSFSLKMPLILMGDICTIL